MGMIQEKFGKPLTINCYNWGTITLLKDNKFHVHMKHINIWYHFICKAVEDAKVSVKYIPTDEKPADIFTNLTACKKEVPMFHWDASTIMGPLFDKLILWTKSSTKYFYSFLNLFFHVLDSVSEFKWCNGWWNTIKVIILRWSAPTIETFCSGDWKKLELFYVHL